MSEEKKKSQNTSFTHKKRFPNAPKWVPDSSSSDIDDASASPPNPNISGGAQNTQEKIENEFVETTKDSDFSKSDMIRSSEGTFLSSKWEPNDEEDSVSDSESASKTKGKSEADLKAQVTEEGKKFYFLLLSLMADPQKEIHAVYEKRPLVAFCVAIALNVILGAFYHWFSASEGLISQLISEFGIGLLTSVLIFGSLHLYLKLRYPKTHWSDALAVLGIACFPFVPCLLIAASFGFIGFPKASNLFYTTGISFSFLFVFLCFIEIFDFPVKRSIYTIPAIFLGSEFVIRTIAGL